MQQRHNHGPVGCPAASHRQVSGRGTPAGAAGDKKRSRSTYHKTAQHMHAESAAGIGKALEKQELMLWAAAVAKAEHR